MIASFKHNFIFLKAKKVAGTSVEMALSYHCGLEDIITPIGIKDEKRRIERGTCPRNYLADNTELEKEYIELVKQNRLKKFRPFFASKNVELMFYNHMPAHEVKQKIGDDFWNRSFKFSIERHPYEKTVSFAYFAFLEYLPQEIVGGLQNIEQVVDYCIEKDLFQAHICNFDVYTIEGKIAVDKIIMYENLGNDLRQVELELGIPIMDELPRAKGHYRQDRTPAKDVLTMKQKRAVQKICYEEFKLFGYDT